MAHYVFVRDDGDGYPDFISDIRKMTVTENKWMAQQFDDDDFSFIDADFLRRNGFQVYGITSFGLRIIPERQFHKPLVAGLLNLLTPPVRAPRPQRPAAPRAMRRPEPRQMMPGTPGMGPRPAPMNSARPIGQPSPKRGGARGPRDPMGGPGHGPMGGPMGGPGHGPIGGSGRR